MILRREYSEWLGCSIEGDLGTVCDLHQGSLTLAFSDFAFFNEHSSVLNRSLKGVSYLLIFVIREKIFLYL